MPEPHIRGTQRRAGGRAAGDEINEKPAPEGTQELTDQELDQAVGGSLTDYGGKVPPKEDSTSSTSPTKSPTK